MEFKDPPTESEKEMKNRLTEVSPWAVLHHKFMEYCIALMNCKNLATTPLYNQVYDADGNFLQMQPTQLEIFACIKSKMYIPHPDGSVTLIGTNQTEEETIPDYVPYSQIHSLEEPLRSMIGGTREQTRIRNRLQHQAFLQRREAARRRAEPQRRNLARGGGVARGGEIARGGGITGGGATRTVHLS